MIELFFGIIIIFGLLTTLQMMISTAAQINRISPVSILKPLKGIDDNLKDNLNSFFNLNYPKYEILFGINSSDDPAVEIVKDLIEKYPRINSKLVISSNVDFLNPKINNLHNIVYHARYDYLLVSDSNVKVDPDHLMENMKLMTLPNAGLVTSTIKGIGAKSLGAVLENLHINTFVAGSVFFISNILRYPVVIGKSMLLRREALEKIKGFKAFANVLAEDHLIGREIRRAGYKIYHSPFVINNINIKWTMKRFNNRHLRWAMMRKKLNLLRYFSEIPANPVMVSFIYLIVNFNFESLIVFALIAIIKILLDLKMATAIGADLKWYQYLLIPAKDIVIGLIWFIPFVHNKIEWRGNSFYISKGTKLKPA